MKLWRRVLHLVSLFLFVSGPLFYLAVNATLAWCVAAVAYFCLSVSGSGILHYRIDADDVFIRHIASHLKTGQPVICTICGREAAEIIVNEKGWKGAAAGEEGRAG